MTNAKQVARTTIGTWGVIVLDAAYREAKKVLGEGVKYDHARSLVRQLATQDDPTHSEELDVVAVFDFFEIRDWGGVLYPVNLRIYYLVDRENRRIVILCVDDKKSQKLKVAIRERIEHRQRMYQKGQITW